ncbi:sarcosine oxidase subunit gamma [Mesorhizobium sp. UC74_2]|uniref:sarcosine oxidase subunit gamma n=2 Tax=unclassified Mesorhizobium TaxID=325217 RepID=UPI00366A8227
MAKYSWEAQSTLRKAFAPGRIGLASGDAGIAMAEIGGFSLVQVMARRGQVANVAKAAKRVWGVLPPEKPGAVAGKGVTLIWTGPDQFFVLSAGNVPDPVPPLAAVFDGMASLSDQSGGRCLIRLSGARVRDALAKVSSIDLHDAVFLVGAAAATSIDHTGVNLWRESDAADGSPVYSLLVFTSFADSLWHTLADAAAEYGIQASRVPLS